MHGFGRIADVLVHSSVIVDSRFCKVIREENAKVLVGDDLWLPQTASMIKFRQIRSRIAKLLEIDESRILPQTRLAAIVPPYRRREILMAIARPERPQRPQTKSRVWVLLTEIVVSTILSLLFLFQPWFLVLLTLPLSVFVANLCRRSQSTVWPSCLETMQELAISQTHYSKSDAARGLWPREEISAKVRWIIANQLGERFDEITEETNFADLC